MSETIERSGVVINTGSRRFTTEYTRTDCSHPVILRMPDGEEINFRMGPIVISPMRWIEIDEDGTRLRDAKPSDIRAAR